MKLKQALVLLTATIGVTTFGQAQSFLTNGLVGYFPFNGNAQDESGRGNDGIILGAQLATDRFGIPNRCYQFDRTQQDGITATGRGLPVGKAPRSVSLWFKVSATETNDARLIGYGPVPGQGPGSDFNLYIAPYREATRNQSLVIDFTYNWNIASPTQSLRGAWHHLVATVDGQSLGLFIDGLSIPVVHGDSSPTNDYFTGNSDQLGSLRFGYFYGAGDFDYFNGYLDDIRIYSRILSAPEVKALYDYEVAPFSEGLVAYYPFNGNANDESGFGNNGLVAGNAHLDVDRFGSPNRAFDFQGGSDSISVSNLSVSTATGAKTTVSFWMNWDGRFYSATDRGCVAFSFSASYHLLFQGAGPGRFGFGTGLGDVWGVNYDSSYSNRWIHVVGIFSNGSTRDNVLFVNGVKVASTMTLGGQASQGSWTDSVSKTATISGWSVNPVTYRFFGGLDDVRIYNRALSDSEVYQLYTAESGPQVALIKAVKPSFVNLIPFNNYQLQVSTDMIGWTNYGSPFTATNSTMVYPEYWDVDNWGQLFFRLLAAP